MRYTLCISGDALAAFGLNRDDLEILARQEENFLATSREYENPSGTLPQGVTSTDIFASTRREQAEFGVAAFPPSSFFEATGSLRLRQQQRRPPLLAVTLSAAPQAPPNPYPHPVRGADWSSIRALVINGTNTYHSYSREAGGGQCSGRSLLNGERVYDERGRWLALAQVDRSTLSAGRNQDLYQMVRDVGGDPGTFGSRAAMAYFVLAQERPLGVVREEDADEIFGGSFPVDLGEPASGCFWGVGQWEGSVLDIAPSTRTELERRL